MSNGWALSAATTLLLTAAACSSGTGTSAEEHVAVPRVAVSVPPLARLVTDLMGDSVEVVTLVPPTADPETYEPTLATMKGLADSQLYLTLDTPGFERAVSRSLPSNFPSLQAVNLSKGLSPLFDHGHSHHHQHDHDHEGHNHTGEEADPHYLTSVRNVSSIVDSMANALSRRWPEKAGNIRTRRDSLQHYLASLDSTITAVFAKTDRHRFAVTHPSLGYFARDYGLTQVALSGGHREMSPQMYAEALDKAGEVAVLFTERTQDPTRAAEAARQLGIPLLTLDLNSESWLESLLTISRSFSDDEDTHSR